MAPTRVSASFAADWACRTRTTAKNARVRLLALAMRTHAMHSHTWVRATALEKDRDGCPKIINLGSAKVDMYFERKKVWIVPSFGLVWRRNLTAIGAQYGSNAGMGGPRPGNGAL